MQAVNPGLDILENVLIGVLLCLVAAGLSVVALALFAAAQHFVFLLEERERRDRWRRRNGE